MAASTLADVSKGEGGGVKGAFQRKPSVFRDAISKGGKYPPAKGRYLLYVSYACPWACRCLALRLVKGLEDAIDVSVVAPIWTQTKPDQDDHRGWTFDPSVPDATTDPIFGVRTIREVYEKATEGLDTKPERFTVPILFDKETKRIVNNESSEIIRFFNSEFNEFAKYPDIDLYPEPHRKTIDEMNESFYETVNNGVYKCGFAQSQEAYDIAAKALFDRLKELEDLLSKQRYLIKGAGLTEADIRLFVTIVRFDDVYVVHFKCNHMMIREFPALSAWMRDVYQTAKLAPSVNMKHICDHYYGSHKTINPYGIIPIGKKLDLDAPYGREGVPL